MTTDAVRPWFARPVGEQQHWRPGDRLQDPRARAAKDPDQVPKCIKRVVRRHLTRGGVGGCADGPQGHGAAP